MIAVGLFIALVAAGSIYQLIGLRRDVRRHTPSGSFVHVEGQRLHVVCAGEGTPAVVFESGIAASSLSWAGVLPRVAAFTRACAYDRAGLGWSDAPRSPRRVDLMLRELQAVVAHASNQRPAVLAGHSFGAFLVCGYAVQRRREVAGLVLLDPPSEWHELTRERARLLRGGIQLSRFGAVLARVGVVRACVTLLTGGAPGVPRTFIRVFGPTAARTIERLVGEIRKLPADVLPQVQAIWCQPKCFHAMADHLAALEDAAAMMRGISSLGDLPLVVVSSGDQPPDVVDRHRALAALSSRGRYVVAARSAHWIQFDEPDLVVSTIREICVTT